MEIDDLVEVACERAGSTDLGEDSWREPLEVLVHSWSTEAALNELGVAAATDLAVGFLTNRLRVEQWYARHPEIDEQEIVAPLFGLGLPRTGSTATSYLARPGPRPALAAGLGGGDAVPASGDGHRAHRPAHRRSPGRHRPHQRAVPGLRRHAPHRGGGSPGVPPAHGDGLPVADLRGAEPHPHVHAAGCSTATWSPRTGTTSAS